MIEYYAQRNGRYLFSDDIINLRDIGLSATQILGVNNYVISGCKVSGNSLSEGYVYLDGKIRKVAATTFENTPATIYIAVKDSDVKEYSADETTEKTKVATDYNSEVVLTTPTTTYIAWTKDKDFPRFEDTWLGKLRLEEELVIGSLQDKFVHFTPGSLAIGQGDKLFKVSVTDSSIRAELNGLLAVENLEGNTAKFTTLSAGTIMSLINDNSSLSIQRNVIQVLNNGTAALTLTFDADKLNVNKNIILSDDAYLSLLGSTPVGLAANGLWLNKAANHLMTWGVIDGKNSLNIAGDTSIENSALSVYTENTNTSGINETLQITSTSILHHSQATNSKDSGFLFKDEGIYIRIAGVDTKLQSAGGLMITGDGSKVSSDNGLTFKTVSLISPAINGGRIDDIDSLSTKGDITITGSDNNVLQIKKDSILFHDNTTSKFMSGLWFTNDIVGFRFGGREYTLRDIGGFYIDNDNQHVSELVDGSVQFSGIKFIDSSISNSTLDGATISKAKSLSLDGPLTFNNGDGSEAFSFGYDADNKVLKTKGNLIATDGDLWESKGLYTQKLGIRSQVIAVITSSQNLANCTSVNIKIFTGDSKTVTSKINIGKTDKTDNNRIVVDVDVSNFVVNNVKYPIDILIVQTQGDIYVNLIGKLGKQLTLVNGQDDSNISHVFVYNPYNSNPYRFDGGHVGIFACVYDDVEKVDYFDTSTTSKNTSANSFSKGWLRLSEDDNGYVL